MGAVPAAPGIPIPLFGEVEPENTTQVSCSYGLVYYHFFFYSYNFSPLIFSLRIKTHLTSNG